MIIAFLLIVYPNQNLDRLKPVKTDRSRQFCFKNLYFRECLEPISISDLDMYLTQMWDLTLYNYKTIDL